MEFLDTVRSCAGLNVRGSAVVRSGWRLRDAAAYLSSLPVDLIKAQMVRVPPGSPLELSRHEKQLYLKDLETIGNRVINDIKQGRVPRDDRFSNRVLMKLVRGKRERYCGAGLTNFGITPSGKILPCLLIESRDALLGNIRDPSTSWLEAGRKWRQLPLRPDCHSCSALDLCGGGCPAIMPVCGQDECLVTRKNCDIAGAILTHFQACPEKLLVLGGIT